MKTFKEKLEEIYQEAINDGERKEYYPQVFIDKILTLIESDIVGEDDEEHPNGNCYQCGREELRQEQRSKLI